MNKRGRPSRSGYAGHIEAYHESALAYAAVKLGLPDTLAARACDGRALAAALGLSPPHLHRFLRGLATIGICEERRRAQFALTSLGQCAQAWLAVPARREGPDRGRAILAALGRSRLDPANRHARLRSGVRHDRVGVARTRIPRQATCSTYLAKETGGAARPDRRGDRSCPASAPSPILPATLLPRFRRCRHSTRCDLAETVSALSDRCSHGSSSASSSSPGRLARRDSRRSRSLSAEGRAPAMGRWVSRIILENCREAMPARAARHRRVAHAGARSPTIPRAIMLDLHMMIITGGRARSSPSSRRCFASRLGLAKRPRARLSI